jgi:methionyl-tRNA formyltransferase
VFFNFMVVTLWDFIARFRKVSLRHVAQKAGIPHRRESAVDEAFFEWLRTLDADWIINGSAFILDSVILGIPRVGTLNHHCAPLPEFRGPGNYFWMFAEGLSEARSTLHYVSPRLDEGDIISYGPAVPITESTSVFSLWRDLRLTATSTFENVLPNLESGEPLAATPQDPSPATIRSFPDPDGARRALQGGRRVFAKGNIRWLLRVGLTGQIPRPSP